MRRNEAIAVRGSYLSLLGLLLTVAVIAIIFYLISTQYLGKSSDEQTQDFLSEQGLSTSTQQGTLGSAREAVRKINLQALNRQKQLDSLK